MDAHLSWAHRRPAVVLALAVAAGAGVAVGMATLAGWSRVGDALTSLVPGWCVVAVLAQVPAMPGYAVAYARVAEAAGAGRPPFMRSFAVVLTGFGGHLPAGGMAYDRRLLGDHPAATMHVLALGVLEYALLAPAAWVAAVALVAAGGGGVQPAVLWPWALCVPLGGAIALGALRHGERRGGAARPLRAIGLVLHMGRAAPLAFAGMAVYWAGEALSLYAGCRAAGVHLDAGALVLGLGSGYALTRRTLPFAGAAITLALMSLALHWVGAALAPAVAATVVYRAVTLGVGGLAALAARTAAAPS